MEIAHPFQSAAFPHLRAATHLVQADLIFVFGNSIIPDELAKAALELWHCGLGKHIVVTGGAIAEFNNFHEAAYLRKALMKGGVPAASITFEGRSTNTLENVIYAQHQLKAEGRYDQISSVIGIGHAVAGTRFTMTLAANWEKPDMLWMHVPVTPQNKPIDYVLRDDAFRARAAVEAAKLPMYVARGHIALVDVAEMNRLVLARIKDNHEALQACEHDGNALTPEQRQSLTTYRLLYANTSPQPACFQRHFARP